MPRAKQGIVPIDQSTFIVVLENRMNTLPYFIVRPLLPHKDSQYIKSTVLFFVSNYQSIKSKKKYTTKNY